MIHSWWEGKLFFTRNRIPSSARQGLNLREFSFFLKEEYERLQQENRQRHKEVRHFESMSVSIWETAHLPLP